MEVAADVTETIARTDSIVVAVVAADADRAVVVAVGRTVRVTTDRIAKSTTGPIMAKNCRW